MRAANLIYKCIKFASVLTLQGAAKKRGTSSSTSPRLVFPRKGRLALFFFCFHVIAAIYPILYVFLGVWVRILCILWVLGYASLHLELIWRDPIHKRYQKAALLYRNTTSSFQSKRWSYSSSSSSLSLRSQSTSARLMPSLNLRWTGSALRLRKATSLLRKVVTLFSSISLSVRDRWNFSHSINRFYLTWWYEIPTCSTMPTPVPPPPTTVPVPPVRRQFLTPVSPYPYGWDRNALLL